MADEKPKRRHLKAAYRPPIDAQVSTMFCMLVVAVGAGLAGDRGRLKKIKERLKAHGIDLDDKTDPRIVGAESYVTSWLEMA